MSLGAKLLRSAANAIAGRFFSTLLGVVTFGLLARTLGAGGLGEYRTVLTLLLFGGVAFDFGLYSVTLREISRADAASGRILGHAVALRIGGTIAAVLILATIVEVSGYDSTICYGVLIAGVGWIGYQLNDLLRAVFQLKLAQRDSAIAEVSGALLTLLLVIVLARAHAGAGAMLAATAAGLACTGILAWYFAFRLIPFRPTFDLRAWHKLVIAGLPFAGSAILIAAHFRVDILLLSLLRSTTDVGLYDAPTKFYELIFMVPYLFGGLMMPLFVRDLASSVRSLGPRLNASVGICAVFATLAIAVFYVNAEPIVVLLAGDKFTASAAPLRILVAAAGFAGLSALLRSAGTALERQHKLLRGDIVSLLVSVGLDFVLIPQYGIIGAALARLAGDFVRTAIAVTILRAQFNRATLGVAAVAIASGVGLTIALLAARDLGLPWAAATAVCGALAVGALLLVPSVRQSVSSLAAA